jgi:hypothetical protein
MSNVETFSRKQWEEAFDWHKDAQRPGTELDWYAIDSKGHIGCFITAGFALVPKFVFRDKEMLWKIYNHFYEEPEDYTFIRRTSSLLEYDVSLYAKRGVYSYDNPSDINKPYELIRSPMCATHATALPSEIREWLAPLTFRDLTFADSVKIDMSKYFECI